MDGSLCSPFRLSFSNPLNFFSGSKELKDILNDFLSLEKLEGMQFNILDNTWKISNDTSVNYIAIFIKT